MQDRLGFSRPPHILEAPRLFTDGGVSKCCSEKKRLQKRFLFMINHFFSITTASESKSKSEDELEALDSELKSGTRNVEEAVQEQQNLSSLVWICTSTHAISKVTVIGMHYL